MNDLRGPAERVFQKAVELCAVIMQLFSFPSPSKGVFASTKLHIFGGTFCRTFATSMTSAPAIDKL
jgi:hypothetical protein